MGGDCDRAVKPFEGDVAPIRRWLLFAVRGVLFHLKRSLFAPQSAPESERVRPIVASILAIAPPGLTVLT
jgi:hypothetical protein